MDQCLQTDVNGANHKALPASAPVLRTRRPLARGVVFGALGAWAPRGPSGPANLCAAFFFFFGEILKFHY